MDSMGSNNVQPVARKAKKKPVKGELDRLKQAEKKKRRLEKALATSAAIRAELEKKKQNKKEEQQRLDEEGAAIAEAVALHVLLGDEDSDDSRRPIMLTEEENLWGSARNVNLFPNGHHATYSADNRSWSSSSYGFNDGGWGTAELSAGLIAAQAVSSLQIGEYPTIFGRSVRGMMNGQFSSCR